MTLSPLPADCDLDAARAALFPHDPMRTIAALLSHLSIEQVCGVIHAARDEIARRLPLPTVAHHTDRLGLEMEDLEILLAHLPANDTAPSSSERSEGVNERSHQGAGRRQCAAHASNGSQQT